MIESWQFTPWLEVDLVMRLLLAAVFGGLIGSEREQHEKPAGFRTLILVCVSSALFGILSVYGYNQTGTDPSRIAAAVVIGIGFLGAGTIMHEGKVAGLTTAAAVWTVAAIGLAVASGMLILAAAVTVITFLVLRLRWEPGRKKL